MNTQTVGCVIVCYWQSGVTPKMFDNEAFRNEVCVPLLDIFATPTPRERNPVDRVLIVTRCAKVEERNKDVEVAEEVFLPTNDFPPHIVTPTSEAVRTNLNSWVRKGQVLCLDVDDTKNEDEAINRAVVFARNQGCHSVIIPHGVPIPDDVVRLGILLKKAQSTGLALRYSVPYSRTADLIDA